LPNCLRATEEDAGARTPGADLVVTVAVGDDSTLWVELRGTADLANHDVLRDALSGIPLNGEDAVHLRLSRLAFCDTRALCHLVAFASNVRRRGQSITTHGASRTFRKMSAVLGADRQLNLV
jgi:anti-anti-sigma regulatory factor